MMIWRAKNVCERADSYSPLQMPDRKVGLLRLLVQIYGLLGVGTSLA